jgi:RecB family exonuclease
MGRRTEFFAMIVEHIRRLANSLEGCGVELSTKTCAALLRRSLQSVKVPFEGEPLEGVQVMGILETRALDFENIIFLSTGDSTMPGSLVGAPSFIPYNLKAAYGLPTPEHHEGVYAYHFFRLITRADRIDAVWSRTTDDRSTGTPSRYILQLDYESPHEVAHETVSVDVNLSPTESVIVEKGAEVASRLAEFTRAEDARRLSPSLFYTYTECPLKFYFRGIAHLRAGEEVSEEVDGALFGNILHRAMQLLYAPLMNGGDPRERLRALIGSAEVERAVTTAVGELYPGEEGAGPEDWGGNIVLVHKMITDYIDRGILPYDAHSDESFTIERLEERIETKVEFETRSEGCAETCTGAHTESRTVPLTVIFNGVADRIDRLPDGSLRVVDYKTGNPKNNASALLQMGLYAKMAGTPTANFNYAETDPAHKKVETALYYVRDMSKAGRNADGELSGVCKADNDSDNEFEETLRATLAELFDTSVPFTQTPDPKRCEWCDFRVICRR